MEKIQIIPVDSFKIPIDLLSKNVADTPLDGVDVDEDGKRSKPTATSKTLTESKKRGIYSDLEIFNCSTDFICLEEFEFAVLNACISEKLSGNEYTTARRIFRRLGGGHVLTPAMRKAILDAVDKLASVRITLNVKDAVKKNILHDEQNRATFKGYLLPTEQAEVSINGRIVNDAIHLLNGGAILQNAEVRNQIVTCDTDLLQPPNIRATPRVIAINHYILRRSKEIIGSNDERYKNRVRKLRKTITFDDMYKKIGLANASRRQKQQARENAIKLFDFLVSQNVLKSYTLKRAKNGEITGVDIDF